MSYILEALRRADAERERGAVPNIHAQPLQGPSNDAACADGVAAMALTAKAVASKTARVE